MDGSSSTGGSALPDAPYGSGTRLTAHVLQAAGGAEVLHYFVDESLGIECTFARDPVGVVRCLPRGSSTAAESDTGLIGFDAAFRGARQTDGCESEAVVRDACDARAEGAFTYVSRGNCGPGPSVREPFEIGEELQLLGNLLSDGTCESQQILERDVAHALVAVDAGGFVSAQMEVVEGVRIILAEDGAWQSLELVESAGRACADEFDVCIPSPVGFVSSATEDPGCRGLNVLGTLADESCDDVPTHAVDWAHGSAPPETAYTVAEPLDTVYRPLAECEEQSGAFWRRGDAVSFAAFPAIQRLQIGEGGVTARYLSFDGTPRVSRTLVDAGTGDECVVWEDGERAWCVPERVWVIAGSARFVDDECTERGTRSNQELPFAAVRNRVDCVDALSFHEVESLEGGTLYRRTSEGTCVEDSSTSDFVYRLGDPYQVESVLFELTPATL